MDRAHACVRRFWSAADANCRALIESEIPLLLGTDAILQPYATAEEGADDDLMRLGVGHFNWLEAMEEKGCAPMRLLRAATRNIAAAYGKEADLGTLEVGKLADILLLSKNPLASARNYRSIEVVIQGGAIVLSGPPPQNPILTLKGGHC
jgi:imidazolonepropionase-like amidohydrolase